MRGTEFEPTAEQRALVESASAFGLTQAEIATQLKISEPTLRKHFRDELSSGKFKVDMTAGKTVAELMKSRDERVRLEAAKYYTARRMGWKETSVSEHTGADGGPIETKDVSAVDLIRARIDDASARLGTGSDSGEPE
jgi:AraC-like DNA-binding protein